VHCKFRADRPNQLWISDFTCVATWQGFVCVAFVIDVFARQGEREGQGELIHHSDRSSQ
jgi:transposase InsO family protein